MRLLRKKAEVELNKGNFSEGKVWGLGRGVSARDVRNLRYPAESSIVLKLLNKVHTLENQLQVLNVKVGAQASDTLHDLSTGYQEVSRNAQPCDKNKGQDSPICDGSQKGSRPDTPVDLDRSNDSPKSGDAFSINVLGHETQRSTRPSKHIDSMQGGHQKQLGKTSSLSKQSNGDIRIESLNHGDKRPNSVELSTKVNPTSGGTLIKGCKLSLLSHAENQKAMGICKRTAEPSMLDMVLREKLNEITLVKTKGNVQREASRNGGMLALDSPSPILDVAHGFS